MNEQSRILFPDNRQHAITQRRLQQKANVSTRVRQLKYQQEMESDSSQAKQLREREAAAENFASRASDWTKSGGPAMPLQRAWKATPKVSRDMIPIQVQTQEELDLFTANIDRLRQRLVVMTPVPALVLDGQIAFAKTAAEQKPEIMEMEPVSRRPYILQEAFQNLGQESQDYWLSLENHTDMMNALGKIVEKANAGVQATGKPVNMKLFNIKIDTLLTDNDDVLMVNIQQLMSLAGGNRDFLVSRNLAGEIPASFGLNCGSTIMDAFNSSLDEMPGEAADDRSEAVKLGDRVNKTLVERVISACVAQFKSPDDFDDVLARNIIEGAVNYKIGLDDNLRNMYTLMSANAQKVISDQIGSNYNYDSVMALMRPLVQEYAAAAYKGQAMQGETSMSALAVLTGIWQELGFDGGDIQQALVDTDDYLYDLPVSDAQIEAIAAAGGIVEQAEPLPEEVDDPQDQEEEIGIVDLFEGPVTTTLPARVSDVAALQEGLNETDNIYYNLDTGQIGSKWGLFNALKNAEARDIFRDGLVYRAMQYLYARMPKANAMRFMSQTEFQDTSPYKLSHATADLASVNMKVGAFLVMDA